MHAANKRCERTKEDIVIDQAERNEETRETDTDRDRKREGGNETTRTLFNFSHIRLQSVRSLYGQIPCRTHSILK